MNNLRDICLNSRTWCVGQEDVREKCDGSMAVVARGELGLVESAPWFGDTGNVVGRCMCAWVCGRHGCAV